MIDVGEIWCWARYNKFFALRRLGVQIEGLKLRAQGCDPEEIMEYTESVLHNLALRCAKGINEDVEGDYAMALRIFSKLSKGFVGFSEWRNWTNTGSLVDHGGIKKEA